MDQNPPPPEQQLMQVILAKWAAIAVAVAAKLRIADSLATGPKAVGELAAANNAKLLDLELLVIASGQERTEAEYGVLLKASGWNLTRIVPTKTPVSIVEGAIPN